MLILVGRCSIGPQAGQQSHATPMGSARSLTSISSRLVYDGLSDGLFERLLDRFGWRFSLYRSCGGRRGARKGSSVERRTLATRWNFSQVSSGAGTHCTRLCLTYQHRKLPLRHKRVRRPDLLWALLRARQLRPPCLALQGLQERTAGAVSSDERRPLSPAPKVLPGDEDESSHGTNQAVFLSSAPRYSTLHAVARPTQNAPRTAIALRSTARKMKSHTQVKHARSLRCSPPLTSNRSLCRDRGHGRLLLDSPSQQQRRRARGPPPRLRRVAQPQRRRRPQWVRWRGRRRALRRALRLLPG